MTSEELRKHLSEFNANISSIIGEYNSVSSSIDSITSNINSIKGNDGAMYDGIIENNDNAKIQVASIVQILEGLKEEVNATTESEIGRLLQEEIAAKKLEDKEMEES